jgi:hypothetical protein
VKKDEIIRLLDMEECRLQQRDNTPDAHNCLIRLTIKHILLEEAKDKQKKKAKVYVSWKRLGGVIYLALDYFVYSLGIILALAFAAAFMFVLWDYYKQFLHY